MKCCIKCGELKPLDDFYRMAGMRDGHRNDCKACSLAAKAARYRANPEPARERARRWNAENKERRAEWMAQYRASGGRRAADRRYHLSKFGLTPDDYDRMLESQNGGCAICGRRPRDDISLHVDHDHRTGKIRGLLCFRCNNSLGDLGDDPELLRKAISYLDQYDLRAQRERALARARALALNPR